MSNLSVVVRIAILAVWMVAVAWLVRYEAYPEYFSHTLAGYKNILSKDLIVRDNWMKILFQDVPIGYSHTTVETDDTNPANYYTVTSKMYVKLKVMGFDQPVYVDTEAKIDMTHQLRVFSFGFSARHYRLNVSGTRIDGNRMRVKVRSPIGVDFRVVDVPDDVVLYSPMTEMALRKLKPGQKLLVRTLDPATMTAANMKVEALAYEMLDVEGVQTETTRLASEYQGATVYSWMDRSGEVVRQETPFGWTMVKTTADGAIGTIRSGGFSGDMLSALAVPCKGVISRPKESRYLKLRLRGVDFPEGGLDSNRQVSSQQGHQKMVLELRSSDYSWATNAVELSEDERAQWLASSSFVQAEHPEMKKAAERITRDLQDPESKARAIFDWVYKNVKKEMTISLPSALDVLHTMAGDCNEHTYLYAGLARAAGLPTKIHVGVAYHEGAFYYHAWPSVFVGDWVEVDPTWGQETVDATHIRIAEGELANQMELVKYIGRLEVEVMDEKNGIDSNHDRTQESL